MSYEINVSLNGSHFFATHERSINSQSQCHIVAKTLLKKFPPSEGYSVLIEYKPQISYCRAQVIYKDDLQLKNIIASLSEPE